MDSSTKEKLIRCSPQADQDKSVALVETLERALDVEVLLFGCGDEKFDLQTLTIVGGSIVDSGDDALATVYLDNYRNVDGAEGFYGALCGAVLDIARKFGVETLTKLRMKAELKGYS